MRYHNQNRIQKQIYPIFRMFKNDKELIQRVEKNGVKVYAPKLNKVRVCVSIGLIGVLASIPFFPEYLFLPKLIKWGIK